MKGFYLGDWDIKLVFAEGTLSLRLGKVASNYEDGISSLLN